MPEFVMEGRDHAARAESDFVLGFIEALFFTESDDLPDGVGYADLHPDSLAAIRADCEAWQAENAALLALAYATGAYDAAQAGRDYWYTRNGHGVGFWDRPELTVDVFQDGDSLTTDSESPDFLHIGELGDMLSSACRYHEVHVFFGDHVTPGGAPFVHVDL